MPYNPLAPSENPLPKSHERDLVHSILWRALLDVFGGRVATVTPKDRLDALHFLIDANGPWAQSRRDWADMAGLDPGLIRKNVLAFLDGTIDPHFLTREGLESTEFDIDAARAFYGRVKAAEAEALNIARARSEEARARRDAAAQARAAARASRATLGVPDRTMRNLILGSLSPEGSTVREIIWELEVSDTVLRRHLDALIDEGRVRKDGPRYVEVAPGFAVAANASAA